MNRLPILALLLLTTRPVPQAVPSDIDAWVQRTMAAFKVPEHPQHDTFVARWTDRELRADAFVTFALTLDGTIDTAKLRAVSPDTDFSFDFQDLLFRRIADR